MTAGAWMAVVKLRCPDCGIEQEMEIDPLQMVNLFYNLPPHENCSGVADMQAKWEGADPLANQSQRNGAERGDWEGFLRDGQELLDLLEQLPPEGEEFAVSVGDKVIGMMESVEQRKSVTSRMMEALMNMRGGAERWIR